MKVLICDPVDDKAVEKIKSAGVTVDIKTEMKPDELLKTIPGYDICVVRSATKITKDVIEAGKSSLKLIIRGGVGVDNIDVEAAKSAGMEVKNTPTASSASVAELALAHIFALYRYIPRATSGIQNGKWEKKVLKGKELSGKTISIIGYGRIGSELAKRCNALGMNVQVFQHVTKIEPLFPQMKILTDLEEAVSTADIVSLHMPKTDKSKNLFDKNLISKMKKGAVLINCARGGIIDEAALAEALKSGHLFGAGLDVFAEEPVKADNPLLNLENVSFTPHIGALTAEAQKRVGSEVADIIIEYVKR
ncbi:hydroxyacid dehydrogenase [candidate division WOR-3 bacterium]|nr:hydroxyacid dehydrogenase [candidate division WOR-3 bacterium]